MWGTDFPESGHDSALDDPSPTLAGARMGRPEKARMSVQVWNFLVVFQRAKIYLQRLTVIFNVFVEDDLTARAWKIRSSKDSDG